MQQTKRVRFGGSFAPPLAAAGIDSYESMAKALEPSPVRDGMLSLVVMLRKFQETPASALPPVVHPALGKAVVVPLEDAEVARIFDVVPWEHECDSLGKVFDTIPADTQPALRNAAFHLLWFARELCADREPTTTDKL